MSIDFGTTDVGNTPIPVTDNSGSLTVDAVSWPLPTGAATEAKQTQPGVDIGDVTINNATGAAAVNVQDGGNILTVDYSPLRTYNASTSGSAITTTTPQDVFTITGSNTQTIKIVKMGMSMTQTTAATVSVSLIKRAANTGGTSSVIAMVPLDSNNAAGTATVRQYTANPTPGAAVGFFMAKRSMIPTATGLYNSLVEWDFSTFETVQRPTLRGTNETLAINLGGTTVTGANPSFYVIWTEE